jgi:cytochrome b involved in lipid metabolism
MPSLTNTQVRKHKSADSIWVTYEGVVYDVTGFVEAHPGGKELLLTAAGLDLSHFFETYTVHGALAFRSDCFVHELEGSTFLPPLPRLKLIATA